MYTRLKSLELQGYKTFASRTLFEFAGTITAIVGPNGSGKSNIADSIRWVLGEQSYSLLRGRKTEDMIFSGSEARARAGMASATMLLDNEDGWLPIEFSEVAITRRAYRDGTNEYLINGQRVRLKDVNELLAQSGLAERTYTIIGQGVVDAALALRPEARRRLFEEAAGIGLYRTRREEALRRLDTTRRNLDRVQDILAELKPRLRSLERQARRSQEHEQLRADLLVLLREWYGYHWHRAQRDINRARLEVAQQEKILAEAQHSQSALGSQLSETRQDIHGLRSRLSSWHRQLALLHNRREELTRQRAVSEERIRSYLEEYTRLDKEILLLEEDLAIQRQRLSTAEGEEADLLAELQEAQAQLEASSQSLQARQAERGAAVSALELAQKELNEYRERQNQLHARQIEHQAQLERTQVLLETTAAALSEAEGEEQAQRARLEAAETAYEQAKEARQAAQAALDEQQSIQAGMVSDRQLLLETQAVQSAEVAMFKAELDVLEQAEASLSGYADGAQILLKAARQARLKGAQGAVSAQLEAPEELERAVVAAMGEYLDAVLLDKVNTAEEALDLLSNQSVRAALLPLDALAPGPPINISDVDYETLGSGLLGLGADLVSAPAGLRPAIDLLLGHTLFVRSRQDARRALAHFRQRTEGNLRAVTLQGDIYYASGPLLSGGGGDSAQTGATLNRPRRRKQLSQNLGDARTQVAATAGEIDEIENAIASSRQRISALSREVNLAQERAQAEADAYSREKSAFERFQRQHAWLTEQYARIKMEISEAGGQAERISAELSALEGQITLAEQAVREKTVELAGFTLDDSRSQESHWRTQVAVSESALQAARSRRLDRQEAVDRNARALKAARDRQEAVERSSQELEAEQNEGRQSEAQVHVEIEALNRQIEPAESELTTAEAQQDELLSQEAESRQMLSRAEHNHAQARIGHARRQEALETLRHRIEDDFGLVSFDYVDEISGPNPLPLDGMVEQLPRVTNLSPEVEEGVRRQRALLRRIGPVNPEAQAEFQEVKERHAFLVEQVADLEKAEADVHQVISELDTLMQTELRSTFDAVAQVFSDIFKRMFGGGSAKLVLTDPDDMTNTGIDIEARLPGRRSQGLSLLSGGERSLTATSLVFALLTVSPTPFCVLDEVDAMLDEANIGRFRDLLRDITKNTQVIIVTHNRNTVQAADVIYGVTMGRDSASQVISLKLDEVSQVTE